MKRQAYQHPEIRDANDNIIQEGTYGKASPLVNGDNTGVLDYINNNLEALYDAQTAAGNAITTGGLTVTGETSVPTANTGNSSKAIANTEFVQGELTNYLPLSGGSITGDVDITGDLSVSGAITGNVLTYKKGAYKEVLEWEDNCMQAVADALATDHPDAYNYGLQVTLGKIGQNGGSCAQLYFPHNDGLYLKNTFNGMNSSGWRRMLDTKNFSLYALPKDGIAVKATADAAGNNIQKTYVKKSDLIGSIQAFAGKLLPTGWLLCDGSAVSRTDYAALFAVIGTTYGAGNGSSTFNLPNLTDKFIQGSATAGTVKSAGLPNITGSVWNIAGKDTEQNGAFRYVPGNTFTDLSGGSSIGAGSFTIDASRSSSVYGGSSTVQPPALTMRYIIKY